jgi:hypothetical protein
MAQRLLTTLVLLTAAVPCRGRPPARDDAVDRAINRGFERLRVLQDSRSGSWQAAGGRDNPAVTSLAVMAFLAAGHVPGEGRHGEAVEKGIRCVLGHQQANGLIATTGSLEMYHHGISTLMLAEVAGMTGSELGRVARGSLERAVGIILRAQRNRGPDGGGWRYRVAPIDGADISVTGWQLMALRAAKNLGCDIPAGHIDRAVDYVKRLQDPRAGGFTYNTQGGLRASCTATGILALEVCGKERHHSDEALRAGAFLIQDRNLPRWGQEWFFYSVYYGAQAAFQLGGNYWAVYRPRMQEVLLDYQQADGGWVGRSRDALAGGPAYCTAMAILALTVDYRYLPIYQRGEEPGD